MSERQILPVVPLRSTVIFPGLAVPTGVGREATLRAIEAAARSDQRVFAVAQRENIEKPEAANLYTMGVIAKIGQIQRTQSGVHLLLEGQSRATALEYRPEKDHLEVVCLPVREVAPPNAEDPTFLALYQELRARAALLANKRGVPEPVLSKVMDAVTDPGAFVDLAAGHLELSTEEKQALLEM